VPLARDSYYRRPEERLRSSGLLVYPCERYCTLGSPIPPAPTPMPDRSTLDSPLRLGLALLLVLVTVLAYAGGLSGEFLYDDLRLIAVNPRTQSLGAALGAFWEPLWSFENPGQEQQAGYWRPLTVLTLAIGRGLAGSEPWGLHALSLGLHILASLAALGVARRLLRHDLGAWMVALLFAMHPVHVQSVAWASAINDPLYGLLSLLSLSAFLRWREGEATRPPLAAGAWLALALLAKEQAIVVVPMALALDFLLPKPNAARQRGELVVRSAVALGAVLAVWLLARMFVFGGVKAGFSGSIVEFGFGAMRQFGLGIEILGSLIGLVLAPGELPFFRGVQPNLGATDAGILIPLAWIGAVLALSLWAWRRQRSVVLVGLALLVLPILPNALLPESAGAYPVADRFAYLAVFGGSLAAVALALHLPYRGLLSAVLLLAATGLGVRTVERTAIYADEVTFFRAAAEESPLVPASHWSLGRVMLERYQRDKEHADLNEALYAYLRCLMLGHDYGKFSPRLGLEAPLKERLNELQAIVHGLNIHPKPDESVMVSVDDRLQANLGQGWCLLFAGQLPPERDLDAPKVIFEEICKAFPGSSEAASGLGTTHMVRGELELAKSELSRAIQLNRANAVAWSNLGETLVRMGDLDGARGAFKEALQRRPRHVADHTRLVRAAIDGQRYGQAEQAIAALQAVVGDDPEVYFLLGMLAASQRQFQEALAYFDRAAAAEPENGDTQLQRGKVLAQIDRIPEAVEALGKACEQLPESFDAHYNLGALLASNPGTAEASQGYLERAYQLGGPGKQRMLLQDELAARMPRNADAIWPYLVFDQRRGDHIAILGWVERTLQLEDAWSTKPDRDARLAAVHLAGANALDGLGHGERAVSAFKNALNLDQSQFWAWHNLALLLDRLEAASEAISAAERGLLLIAQVQEDLRSQVTQVLEAVRLRNQRRLEEFVGPTLPLEDRKDIPGGGR
jgi:tetratricopeptide (TPR) repeat protein